MEIKFFGMTHIIANWKDYLTPAESVKLFTRLVVWEKTHPWPKNISVTVAPSALALGVLTEKFKRTKTRISFALQDIGWAEGAYTGALSARDARALGVRTVLVGHSERRQYFGEDEKMICKKTAAALAGGLRVILCVGETKDERQSGRAVAVVRGQIESILKDSVVVAHLNRLLIAYEPRWAIGTGIPIESSEAEVMHAKIAGQVSERAAVLYGGSVTPQNVAGFIAREHTAGVLVGSASTKFTGLTGIIARAARVRV